MKNDFYIEMCGLTGDDLGKFSCWLTQFKALAEIDKIFEENQDLLFDENAIENLDFLKSQCKKAPVKVAPGQIRYFDNTTVARENMSIDILVLSQWDDAQHWLIAPFSPYSTPATLGELKTNLDSVDHAVIESWNATVVPDAFLFEKSTFLCDVDDGVRLDTCIHFFQQLEGTEMPAHLKERVGPPIQFRLDPRIQYIREEQMYVSKILKKADDYIECLADEMIPSSLTAENKPFGAYLEYIIPFSLWEGNAEAIAADSSNNATTARFFTIEKIGAPTEHIKIYMADDELRLQVFNAQRTEYSNVLDSWRILNENGTELGKIEKGRFRINLQDAGHGIFLTDPNGNIYKFNLIEE